MLIAEQDVLDELLKAKNVILLEPDYERRHLPSGLAKIASFLKNNGINFSYTRQYNGEVCDLICVTTLFTYESKQVKASIDRIYELNPNANVIIGGIFASVKPKWFLNNFPKAKVFVGYSRTLDCIYPLIDDASFWEIDDKWNDYFTIFTTRGCTNKCAYCAVWRIEEKNGLWINPNWKELLNTTPKKNIMVSDNNLTLAPREHFIDVMNELYKINKSLLFNNGLDAKHITEEYATLLGRLKFEYGGGLSVAFDRIEEDGIYQDAVKMLHKFGVKPATMKAFVLFNFTDTPQEAHYRMAETFRLGVRPYPQRYASLYALNRYENMFIGKHWTKNLTTVFRFYWLWAGAHKKYTFEDAVKSGKFRQMKMNDEDWEKWYVDYGKYGEQYKPGQHKMYVVPIAQQDRATAF